MCSTSLKAHALDTLEQLDQSPHTAHSEPFLERVHPAQVTLQKRARAKSFSFGLSKALYAEACKQKEADPEKGGQLKRAYGRGLDCTGQIVQEADGSQKAHYCGNRWCMVCNRIRTARAIQAYEPALEAWGDDAYFVTLTVENCTGDELRSTIRGMTAAFTSCKRTIKRTHGLLLEAIRKLEVTYNWKTDTYHPHFHIIVNGEAQAEALKHYWLQRSERRAVHAAQDVRPLDKGGKKEIFKYFTKLLADGKEGKKADPKSLNVIFEQIKGLRTYQPIGFKIKDYAAPVDPDAPLETVNTTKAYKRSDETVVWTWMQDYFDWVDWDTGECLTDYTPTDKWRDLCQRLEPDPVLTDI